MEIALGVALGLLIFEHRDFVLGLLCVCLLLGGGYWVWKRNPGFFYFAGGLLLVWVVGNWIESWNPKPSPHGKIARTIRRSLGFATLALFAFWVLGAALVDYLYDSSFGRITNLGGAGRIETEFKVPFLALKICLDACGVLVLAYLLSAVVAFVLPEKTK